MTQLTLSLPESLWRFVEAQLAIKGYQDPNEYFCILLQEARSRDEESRFENRLLEGLSGGDDQEATPAFWHELRGEVRSLIRGRFGAV